MPRNYRSLESLIQPDSRFNSKLVTKIVNKLMWGGKKSTARRIFYLAVDEAAKRLNVEAKDVFEKAIDNVKPRIEVRSKRVGGATYQVPMEVRSKRQQSLAIRWLVDAARDKRGKPMWRRLAEEMQEAFNNQGAAVSKKDNVHKMAEANKAYAHFAWGRARS
jgi:small subunit ribosomal protein S7